MYQRLVKARRMIRRRIREGQPFMFLDKGARGSRPSAVHEQPRRIMERAPARHAAPPPRTAAGQTAEGDLLVVPPAHGTARKRRVARGQRDDRRTTRAPLPAGMGEKPAEHARDVRAYRNFCGAYNRGPALWEQACRPVIFVAWKMMRPRCELRPVCWTLFIRIPF